MWKAKIFWPPTCIQPPQSLALKMGSFIEGLKENKNSSSPKLSRTLDPICQTSCFRVRHLRWSERMLQKLSNEICINFQSISALVVTPMAWILHAKDGQSNTSGQIAVALSVQEHACILPAPFTPHHSILCEFLQFRPEHPTSAHRHYLSLPNAHHLALHCCLPRVYAILLLTSVHDMRLVPWRLSPRSLHTSSTNRSSACSSAFVQTPANVGRSYSHDRSFALTPALNMAVFEMVSVPVTTVRVGSTDNGADWFPTLSMDVNGPTENLGGQVPNGRNLLEKSIIFWWMPGALFTTGLICPSNVVIHGHERTGWKGRCCGGYKRCHHTLTVSWHAPISVQNMSSCLSRFR
jgi:hypothetical protein